MKQKTIFVNLNSAFRTNIIRIKKSDEFSNNYCFFFSLGVLFQFILYRECIKPLVCVPRAPRSVSLSLSFLSRAPPPLPLPAHLTSIIRVMERNEGRGNFGGGKRGGERPRVRW